MASINVAPNGILGLGQAALASLSRKRPRSASQLDVGMNDSARSESSPSSSEDSDGDPPGYVAPVEVVALPPGLDPAAVRSFQELEEILFSNPKSFTSMAFAIAA